MRTPAGQECPYYYADFHRGHHRQECRLLGRNPTGPRWQPSDCGRCPVPRIVMANACPHLRLEAEVQPGVLGIGRHVEVHASCDQYATTVSEPEIGCGHCHEAFSLRSASGDDR